MGLSNFVRTRKQVKADRAGMASHQKLIAALGGNTKGPTTASFDKHADEAMALGNSGKYSPGSKHEFYNQEEDKY
jgi:hypothetical protein